MGGGTFIPPGWEPVISSSDLSKVFQFINNILVAPTRFFQQLIESAGIDGFWISCIFVLLVGRFILVPLFGSSVGSDKAQKKDTDNG